MNVPPYNLPRGGATSCGSVGPYYNNPTTKNFEPRIGFAWDPFKNGKTSVRGSFGIYDVDPFAGYFLLQQNQEGPFVVFKSVTGNPSITGNGFVPDGGGAALVNPALPAKLSASTVEASPHRTYVDEWGLTIQRQLTSDMTLTVGYVGSHGLHLITRGDDGNMAGAPGSLQQAVTTPYGYLFPCFQTDGACVPGETTSGASNQLNPNIGVIRYIFWNASSNYNGLNVNLEKRFSHGVQFQVAYTFAKSLDDTSQTIAGDTFGNGINSPWWWLPQAFYGPSDFNVAHNLSINALYTVPTPKSWSGAMKEALADWELGGIFTYNSGIPTTPINNGDPLGLGNGGADQFGPLVRVPGCDPIDHGYAGSLAGKPQWINTNCFAEPSIPGNAAGSLAYGCAAFSPVSAFGNNPNNPGFDPTMPAYCANLAPFNVGRNSITGPHLFNLDFSVHKTFPIKERFNLQFRAEFFNITNHNNFVTPMPCSSPDCQSGIYNQNGTSAGAGLITTYANAQQAAREMQFALKFNW